MNKLSFVFAHTLNQWETDTIIGKSDSSNEFFSTRRIKAYTRIFRTVHCVFASKLLS